MTGGSPPGKELRDKSMARFPLFIDLSELSCLVVGGGKVALRKIEALLRYEAKIQVVSGAVSPEIRRLLPPDRIHLLEITVPEVTLSDSEDREDPQRNHTVESWLKEADLVIAATNDREANHYIAALCKKRRIPVNVIDAPEECSFLFPSIVKKGEISIGINTDGQSPIVSKKVRQEIEKAVPDYYGDIAAQLGAVKDYVKEAVSREDRRRNILRQVAGEAFSLGRTLTEEELDKIYEEFLS